MLSVEETINSKGENRLQEGRRHLSWALQNKWMLQAGKGKEGTYNLRLEINTQRPQQAGN